MTEPCKACGSTKTPIVYGLPSDRAMAASQRGEVRLGGCALPHWPTCRRCGNTLDEDSRSHRAMPRIPGLPSLPGASSLPGARFLPGAH